MSDLLATPAELLAMPGLQQTPRPTARLLLEIATAVVQAATGQRLVAVCDDTLVLDLDDDAHTKELLLPEQPVTGITAVWINEAPVSDYTVRYARGALWRACGWRAQVQNWRCEPVTVTVTYDHGYPRRHHGLQLARSACLMLAASVATGTSGITSESIGDYSVTYQAMTERLDSAPLLQKALRRRYARTRFASLRLTR